jgi:hypothetical protein
MQFFPKSQSELIRRVRGNRSQAAFARELGCDRSCLSRYENESLGAPTTVISYCLKAISEEEPEPSGLGSPIDGALRHAKEVVATLERLKSSSSDVDK